MFSIPARGYSEEAVNQAARALYYQMHWNEDIDHFTKEIEKNFTKEQKEVAAWVAALTRAGIDQQITYTWRFP